MKKIVRRCAAALAAVTFVAPALFTAAERTATADVLQKKLTDAQVLGVFNAVNDGFIAQSRLLTDSKNSDVKDLAQQIVSDHRDVKQNLQEFAKNHKMTPSEPPQANKIRESTNQSVARLKKLSGADLDRTYVDMMVGEYKDRISLIDQQVLPSISNEDLKEQITSSVRPELVDNQKRAQEVSQKLSGPPKPSAAR